MIKYVWSNMYNLQFYLPDFMNFVNDDDRGCETLCLSVHPVFVFASDQDVLTVSTFYHHKFTSSNTSSVYNAFVCVLFHNICIYVCVGDWHYYWRVPQRAYYIYRSGSPHKVCFKSGDKWCDHMLRTRIWQMFHGAYAKYVHSLIYYRK